MICEAHMAGDAWRVPMGLHGGCGVPVGPGGVPVGWGASPIGGTGGSLEGAGGPLGSLSLQRGVPTGYPSTEDPEGAVGVP